MYVSVRSYGYGYIWIPTLHVSVRSIRTVTDMYNVSYMLPVIGPHFSSLDQA